MLNTIKILNVKTSCVNSLIRIIFICKNWEKYLDKNNGPIWGRISLSQTWLGPGKTIICYSKTCSVAVVGDWARSGQILSLSLQQTLINTRLMEQRRGHRQADTWQEAWLESLFYTLSLLMSSSYSEMMNLLFIVGWNPFSTGWNWAKVVGL